MSVFKKTASDAAKEAGILTGGFMSQNMQNATNSAVEGMKNFRAEAFSPTVQNKDFTFAKGNLFEYIEAAKFNVDAASKGSNLNAFVTDIEDPHAAADILIRDNGNVVREVQAKFSDSKNAAADSVFMQSKEKYTGMQRLIRKEEHYIDKATGKETTLLEKSKEIAKNRSEIDGNLHQRQYKDTYDNLTDELNHENVSSGGTTLKEVKRAYDSPEKFAMQFEKKAVRAEMKANATNMAKASFVMTGVVSGISNMAAVFKDEKSLGEAIGAVSSDAVKGAARGAATGVLSTSIRYKGIKAGSALLSDATASTVMAGGMIDGGVALLAYAKGEINEKELKEKIVDTTAKSTITIFFSRAVKEVMGRAVNPLVPFAVYTTASYVFTATREIIKNANLQAEENDRLNAILIESKKQIEEYEIKIKSEIEQIDLNQKQMMKEFLETFNYNLETGENYDEALNAIVKFANQAGISLQHVTFDEFSNAMRRKDVFSLE
ncbi:hypothetical protein [Pseudobutyrivibrio sp. LB2011]|uniref:hypothetical protein n=1 Tax=Pseudobutyrivibrio sp. LB2011 TaxID=1408312 RepID=UPI0005D1F88A|nr:hypothetical protein [Pseudobutyrivibrio sp. LB2011]